ncbi:MAG: lactate dehydrogenase [Candidatus Helarchaeota archaeon]|nr:lactate dehydrogenase [Candidatus Helarchaeota archaeon]
MKILFCGSGWKTAADRVKKRVQNFEFKMQDMDRPLIEQVADVTVIIPTMEKITEEIIKAAKKLKLIQQFGVGLEGIDRKAAKEHGVYVANCTGANAITVAESVIFLMLGLSRKLPESQATFNKRILGHPIGSELFGKKLGIIGLGNSGRELVKRAYSMGMKIYATKRTPNKDFVSKYHLEFLGGPKDLNYVLKEADFVSLHTPLTEETRNLISETELKQMKPSAFLINVSRGPVIDKDALLKALQEKWIAGVALDVYWEEPADPEDPLFQFKNIIAMPHIAGSSEESQVRMTDIVVENVFRVAEGKKPINIQN